MKSFLNKTKICVFRLKGLTAFQAKKKTSERDLYLITSWQNFKLPRIKNEKCCRHSVRQK